MKEKCADDNKETLETLLLDCIHSQEALANLLEKKGVITKAELSDEIEKLRQEHSCYMKK